MRQLLNLKDVEQGYGSRSAPRGVTLGVAAGERIGVVGANGDGKSTLPRLIAGVEEPGAGAVTRTGGVAPGLLRQGDELDAAATIRSELVGDRADHEWQADAAFRSVLDGLLGGVALTRFAAGLDTPITGLSGGERRRIGLAQLLLGAPELLLLDEPTNDLDIDTLTALEDLLDSWPGTLVAVTHDRWFVERVCDDVHALIEAGARRHLPGGIEQYVAERRAVEAPAPPAELEALAAEREALEAAWLSASEVAE